MANLAISALTAASTPLAGTEVLPIVQSSATVKVAVSDLTVGRSVTALSYVTTGSTVVANGLYLPAANTVGIATNGTLRVSVSTSLVTLASGMGLTLTDGDVTLSEGKLTITDTAAENALTIAAGTTTTAALGVSADSLTSGFVGSFYTNSADTGAGSVLRCVNDNASATGRYVALLQQDAANAFMNLVGTAAANTTDPISTLTTSGATTGHIQIDINGTKAWIAVSTNNPS